MSEFHTAGEILVDRPLAKEVRSGVSHFVSGQHEAKLIHSTGTHALAEAELSYVDVMGHAVLVMCALDEERVWRPVTVARAGQIHTFQPCLAYKAGFELSDKMIETLRGIE